MEEKTLGHVALAILFSAGSGFLFMYLFMKRVKRLQPGLLKNEPNFGQTPKDKAPMNHFKGVFVEGGTGYLLQDKLIFIPHKLNLSKERVTVLFTDVRSASGYKVFGIVNVGLKITLKSGKKEKFIVDKSGEFFQLLMANLK